ncbi:MAG: transposase [Oscillospiraceae bacterium]
MRLLSPEGKSAPDHNTIARFRREHLPYAVEDLLNQMVKLLVECGEISFEESVVFIDGTKIEANANRYSFVLWKTAVTKRQSQKLGKKIPRWLAKLQGQLIRHWDHRALADYTSETGRS